MIPEIHARELLASGHNDHAGLMKAFALFNVYGVLIVRGHYSAQRIGRLRNYFTSQYAQYLEYKDYDDALGVGEGRTMISVKVADEFAKPALFSSRALRGLLTHTLSDEYVLGAMSVVVAVPGAEKQHGHPDHGRLFGDDQLEQSLPPYAINVMTPLVDVDESNGATVVHPGSHKVNRDDQHKTAGYPACLQRGDSLLMDVRIWHSGLPNQSRRVRPLLSMTYYRPWFRDASNHADQPELVLDQATLDALPRRYANLFAAVRYKR